MTLQTGVPMKVLRSAHEHGMHNDCIAADYAGACLQCRSNMMLAFDGHYGHLSSDDVFGAILMDLEADARDVS